MRINGQSKIGRTLASAIVALLTFGCASIPGGHVDIVQNRKIEYVLTRGRGPAVIFENGLGGQYHWWAKIYPEIAKSQTAFAYNRPGYGNSDHVTTTRDAATIVEELRESLRELKITPPYVLVGHSLGGLYFQYYARRYPEETKALILVDSTHPQQMEGDGATERWPWWTRTMIKVLTPKAGLEELAQIENGGQQVVALPPLATAKIQTAILLASEPEHPSSPLEKHAVAKRQNFRLLYPGTG